MLGRFFFVGEIFNGFRFNPRAHVFAFVNLRIFQHVSITI